MDPHPAVANDTGGQPPHASLQPESTQALLAQLHAQHAPPSFPTTLSAVPTPAATQGESTQALLAQLHAVGSSPGRAAKRPRGTDDGGAEEAHSQQPARLAPISGAAVQPPLPVPGAGLSPSAHPGARTVPATPDGVVVVGAATPPFLAAEAMPVSPATRRVTFAAAAGAAVVFEQPVAAPAAVATSQADVVPASQSVVVPSVSDVPPCAIRKYVELASALPQPLRKYAAVVVARAEAQFALVYDALVPT